MVLLASALAVLLTCVAPACATSRANMAWSLRKLAMKQQNNSLRYLHTTWFAAEGYQYVGASTASIALAGVGQLPETMEVLDPPYGYSAADADAPRSGMSIAAVVPTGEPVPGTTRGQASAAYATALALANGTFDPKAVKVSRAEALRRTVAWTNGLALSHAQGLWGGNWQTALWAFYLGSGSKRIWNTLPLPTQQLVSSVVATEADRLLTIPPPFYCDASGTVLTPGDSKAEENAWNASLLFLASRMYSNGDPVKAAQWEGQARWYALTAFATPDEVGTDPRIQGSNLNVDGTVTNHGIIHPDYMVSAGSMLVNCALVSAWSKTELAGECSNRLTTVWTALTRLKFPVPPFRKPGGTIFRVGSKSVPTSNIYWPQGTDWATTRKHNMVLMDVGMVVAGYNYGFGWAKAHVNFVLHQQSRHKDGRVFSRGETNYPQDEQFAAVCAAETVETLRYVR